LKKDTKNSEFLEQIQNNIFHYARVQTMSRGNSVVVSTCTFTLSKILKIINSSGGNLVFSSVN